jgi:hypothetical protein
LVIAKRANQLGNQLFTYASLIACGLTHGQRVANLAFGEYAAHFEHTRHDLFCRYPARRTPLAGSQPARRLVQTLGARLDALAAQGRLTRLAGRPVRRLVSGWDSTLADAGGVVRLNAPALAASLDTPQILMCSGPLFRDDPSLTRWAAPIRRFFTPRADHQAAAERTLAQARQTADVVVGVHVRRGDYRTFAGGRYFFPLEVYAAQMAHAATLFPGRRVGVVVTSDEALSAADFAGQPVTLGPGQVVADLETLSRCDYLIGPPSSFSMWASFMRRVPYYALTDAPARPTLNDFSLSPIWREPAPEG